MLNRFLKLIRLFKTPQNQTPSNKANNIMLTQSSPILHTFKGKNPRGFHNLTYYTWGNPTSKVLIMVHGLSRNGRDFDVLAEALSDQFYVVCPDIVGRGKSDWLPEDLPQAMIQGLPQGTAAPKAFGQGYTYDQYMNDLTALIARLNVPEVYWLGTSMGGLLGMIMASLPQTPIKRLVINDIGPYITAENLEKVRGYIGIMPTFRQFDSALNFIKQMYAPFGNLTDEQWQHMAEHSFMVKEDSKNDINKTAEETVKGDRIYQLHYDPRIALFKNEQGDSNLADVNLWPCWLTVSCPTLVLRGEHSEIFPSDLCQQMITKPNTIFHEIQGAGHAPALMSQHEIGLIRDWFCKELR